MAVSQEKHAAVARPLRDAEGKLWTNDHIAKPCKVSRTVVDNVLPTLKASDLTYAPPTTQKYINRHGKEAWTETHAFSPPRTAMATPSRETRTETLETARKTIAPAGTALMAAVDAFPGDCATACLLSAGGM